MTQTEQFPSKDRLQHARSNSVAAPRALRLLHVDDCKDDRIVLQAACKRARVHVDWHVADSADKAIEYLRGLIGADRTEEVCWPDLVLLDLSLGEQGGFEVLKYVRANPLLRGLPVVMFTGQEDPALKEEAFQLGANSVVIKPVLFDQMVELAGDLFKKWAA